VLVESERVTVIPDELRSCHQGSSMSAVALVSQAFFEIGRLDAPRKDLVSRMAAAIGAGALSRSETQSRYRQMKN
jgi:hypothetical protein